MTSPRMKRNLTLSSIDNSFASGKLEFPCCYILEAMQLGDRGSNRQLKSYNISVISLHRLNYPYSSFKMQPFVYSNKYFLKVYKIFHSVYNTSRSPHLFHGLISQATPGRITYQLSEVCWYKNKTQYGSFGIRMIRYINMTMDNIKNFS